MCSTVGETLMKTKRWDTHVYQPVCQSVTKSFTSLLICIYMTNVHVYICNDIDDVRRVGFSQTVYYYT